MGVLDTASSYDVILGLDFLSEINLVCLNSTQRLRWLDSSSDTPSVLGVQDYRPRDTFADRSVLHTACLEALAASPLADPDFFDDDDEPVPPGGIKDANYGKVDVPTVIARQQHLNHKQKRSLSRVLSKYSKLFSGELGVYPHKKMDLDLRDNAKPLHSRPYAVPHSLQPTFKKELDHLVSIDVLEPAGSSEWAAGTFIIPKKD